MRSFRISQYSLPEPQFFRLAFNNGWDFAVIWGLEGAIRGTGIKTAEVEVMAPDGKSKTYPYQTPEAVARLMFYASKRRGQTWGG